MFNYKTSTAAAQALHERKCALWHDFYRQCVAVNKISEGAECLVVTTAFLRNLGTKYNLTADQANRVIITASKWHYVCGWHKNAKTSPYTFSVERHTRRRPIPRDPYHMDRVIMSDARRAVFFELKRRKATCREIYSITGMGLIQQQRETSNLKLRLGEVKGYPKLNEFLTTGDFYALRDSVVLKHTNPEKAKLAKDVYKLAIKINENVHFSSMTTASYDNLWSIGIDPDKIQKGIFTPKGNIRSIFKENKNVQLRRTLPTEK